MELNLQQELDAKRGRAEPTENDLDKAPILRLDDYSILHIYSFLTFGEQVNMSVTCVRFSRFFNIVLGNNNELIISEQKPLTIVQLKEISQNVGHELTKIKCFWYQTLPIAVFKEIRLNMSNLTTLELSSCNIDDSHCKNFVSLQNLEFLDLSNNKDITGKYLDQFSKLVHLNIRGCLNIESSSFGNICNRGLLKWLNIIKCSFIINDCFPEAIFKLKNLEEFSFCSTCNIDRINKISEFKHLKALYICEPYQEFVTLNFLEELVKNKSEQLEALSFEGFCYNEKRLPYIGKLKGLRKLCIILHQKLDNFPNNLSGLKQLNYLSLAYCFNARTDSLLTIFEQLHNISELDITGWAQFTDKHLFAIAEIIKAKATKTHCTIYGGETGISEDIFENKKYMEYEPFVAVSFKLIPYEMSNTDTSFYAAFAYNKFVADIIK